MSVALIGGGASCAAARDFVRSSLAETGWHGDVEAAVLLTSELVANASRHAGGRCQLCLSIDGPRLRIEATDRNTRAPVLRRPSVEDESGRGLLLVDVLSKEWGVQQRDGDGKTVWFELSA
ncbi:MAG: hypothetical protein JWM85_2246 [Acidimicrobiaceae bacterium]|nr:hypothetical protein [Acidimicrobiaceae bacterium]